MSDAVHAYVEAVPAGLLEALAGEAPAPDTKPPERNSGSHRGDFSRLMVDRWLQDNGIAFRLKPQPAADGRAIYVLKRCPFDPSHGDPDSCIMQGPDGRLSAKCFHDSCAGRGWQEFKRAIGEPRPEHFDPPLKPRIRQGSAESGNGPGEETPPPAVAVEQIVHAVLECLHGSPDLAYALTNITLDALRDSPELARALGDIITEARNRVPAAR
jgi:hypothetical protein